MSTSVAFCKYADLFSAVRWPRRQLPPLQGSKVIRPQPRGPERAVACFGTVGSPVSRAPRAHNHGSGQCHKPGTGEAIRRGHQYRNPFPACGADTRRPLYVKSVLRRDTSEGWCRRDSGFSLLELAIVLAGAMIVLGTAVPVVTSVMDGYRLTLTAQSIVSQLQFARMKSVSSNEALAVRFPSDRDVYQVETITPTILAGPFALPDGISWVQVDFGGQRRVEFSPTGAGTQGTVTLTNRAGMRIDVNVGTAGDIRQSPPYHP